MGYHNAEFKTKNGTFSQAKTAWKEWVDGLSRDSYDGEDSIHKFTDRLDMVFNNEHDASEWISENCDRNEAVFVRIIKEPKKSYQSKLKTMQEKVSLARKSYSDLLEKALSDMKNAKSKTIGCQNCESKVNRKYLKNSNCPVCGATLMSTTLKKRIEAKREKITEANKKIKDFKLKNANDSKVSNNSTNKDLYIFAWGWARDPERHN